MRSTTKLNSGILSLLKLMDEKYPELLRNMDENPVASPDPVSVPTAHFELEDYYNALRAIYAGYDREQQRKSDEETAADCE
jgi:hypothetical protein